MDNILDRKSFEVGGHWPLWREWKNRMTMQNRQKSNAKKNNKTNKTVNYPMLYCNTCETSYWVSHIVYTVGTRFGVKLAIVYFIRLSIQLVPGSVLN